MLAPVKILVSRTRYLPSPVEPSAYFPAISQIFQAEAERELSSVMSQGLHIEWLKASIDASGYAPLSAVDMQRSVALNAGYLKRLSIKQSTSNLDTLTTSGSSLYDGKLLVFQRGYGQEELSGRLLLEKCNYLQSTLVQRAVAPIASFLGSLRPTRSAERADAGTRSAASSGRYRFSSDSSLAPFCLSSGDEVPAGFASVERMAIEDTLWRSSSTETAAAEEEMEQDAATPRGHRMLDYSSLLATSNLTEPTFRQMLVVWRPLPPRAGRASVFGRRVKRVVQLAAQPGEMARRVGTTLLWPVVSRLPFVPERIQTRLHPVKPPPPPPPPPDVPLELRVFTDVPMANFGAILPGNRLAVSPAEALRLDVVSLASLLVLLLRFRSGVASLRVELFAASAVGLWSLRTLLSYRNARVRYEALRLRLLTSKTLVRSSVDARPVVRFLAQEAATQRARRVELLLNWLLARHLSTSTSPPTSQSSTEPSSSMVSADASAPSLTAALERDAVIREELRGSADELVSAYLGREQAEATPVDIDPSEAVDDLRRLGLLRQEDGGSADVGQRQGTLQLLSDPAAIHAALKKHWGSLLEA